MIWQPKPGQRVRINYKDKSMPYQGCSGIVVAVGRGIKNAQVRFPTSLNERLRVCVIPRGNLVHESK